MIKKLLFVVCLLLPTIGFSQTNIQFKIDNQQDGEYYFCKYVGAKSFVLDTLKSKNGTMCYKSKTKLTEGIYLLKNSNNFPLTEVLVSNKQRFKVIINDLDNWSTYKVKGSAKETKLYYELMAKVRKTEADIAALESEEGYHPENWKKADSLKKDLDNFEESLRLKKKDAFINTVISSLKRHTMDDYWDDFPLNDPRVITYPLIENKLNTYFDNLYNDAKLINEEIDKLIAKTGDCIAVRDYLLWYFYIKYFNPKYMNLDDVYIHLVDDYFMKLDLPNVTSSMLSIMADRASYLENLKIGAKLPEIGDMYSIEASYIVVVFYDKTCQKCAKEGLILEETRERHPEMVIFPVEINSTDINNLLSKYDIQNTPMIYVLDKDKHIIAKRIKAEQVELVLNMD